MMVQVIWMKPKEFIHIAHNWALTQQCFLLLWSWDIVNQVASLRVAMVIGLYQVTNILTLRSSSSPCSTLGSKAFQSTSHCFQPADQWLHVTHFPKCIHTKIWPCKVNGAISGIWHTSSLKWLLPKMCNTTQTLITAVYNTVEMYTTKNVLEVVLLAKLLVCHFINRYNVLFNSSKQGLVK